MLIRIIEPSKNLLDKLDDKKWIVDKMTTEITNMTVITLRSNIRLDMKDGYFISLHDDKKKFVFGTIEDLDVIQVSR